MAGMTNVQKSRSRLLIHHPFWATLMLSVPAVEDRTVETAYTTGKKIGYNPDFMESLPVDVCEFVWAHETGHDMLLHGLRLRGRNPRRWNIACDYAINLHLKDCGFKLWDKCLIDEKYRNMSADDIYDQLAEDEKNGGGEGKPDGLGEDVRGPQSADEAADTKQQIQQRVAQAANMARMAGKLPAGMERLIDGILNPEVSWEVLLRDYMTRISNENESWQRRNRRFDKVVLPGRWSQKLGDIIYIGDTSGSISNEENTQGAMEVSYIADNLNPEHVRLVWCDTQVAGEQEFAAGEPIDAKPMGGGGTDMRVALEHVAQYDPQIVVLYTDGYTPWPDVEPDYPLIVCCTSDAEVPIGQVIRVKARA